MAAPYEMLRPNPRLIADAKAWLPTDDTEAQRSIAALLAMTAQAGVDPIAALREALYRWFGSAASDLLGPSTMTGPVPPLAPGFVALEPLPPLRRPTLWPQRPKRFADELFSSWLWRTSIAAGAPPDQFAVDALGGCFADPDTEVPGVTLLRLALLSGQSGVSLAAGTLTVTEPITRADVVHDALLRQGGFLLMAEPSDGRPRPVLQYCPRCLTSNPQPYFRRRWRLATEAVCVLHRCRLHDACWRCGAFVDLLGQRVASREPACTRCAAMLAKAPAVPAPDAVRGQRGLTCVLCYAAACLEPEALRMHLETLASQFATGGRVVEREQVIAECRPSNLPDWFGPVSDPHHRDLLRQHAGGKAHSAWFGPAGVPAAAAIPDLPLPPRTRPLSGSRRSRAAWFAAATTRPPPGRARSNRPEEPRHCPPPA